VKQLFRVAAFIMFSSAFVHAQTIADLARKERARRQSAPKTLVITNDQLKSASSSKPDDKPTAESTPPELAPAAPEVPAAAAGPGGHDEKWWRGQFEKVREEIQRLETQIPLLESNLNTANREFLTRSYDPDGRGKKAIDDAKAKLDDAKSGLAAGEERLTQLEEELRRAGGPAGWAR
jgi:hypothetical protein